VELASQSTFNWRLNESSLNEPFNAFATLNGSGCSQSFLEVLMRISWTRGDSTRQTGQEISAFAWTLIAYDCSKVVNSCCAS